MFTPSHPSPLALDPYFPCEDPRQSGGSTQFPSLICCRASPKSTRSRQIHHVRTSLSILIQQPEGRRNGQSEESQKRKRAKYHSDSADKHNCGTIVTSMMSNIKSACVNKDTRTQTDVEESDSAALERKNTGVSPHRPVQGRTTRWMRRQQHCEDRKTPSPIIPKIQMQNSGRRCHHGHGRLQPGLLGRIILLHRCTHADSHLNLLHPTSQHTLSAIPHLPQKTSTRRLGAVRPISDWSTFFYFSKIFSSNGESKNDSSNSVLDTDTHTPTRSCSAS